MEYSLTDKADRILKNEINANKTKQNNRMDLQSLLTCSSVDQTAVLILLQGLAGLAKERPSNSTKFLHLVATVALHDYKVALIAMILLPTLEIKEPAGQQNSFLELQKGTYPPFP